MRITLRESIALVVMIFLAWFVLSQPTYQYRADENNNAPEATYTIKYSPGGSITQFIQKYMALSDEDTKLVIDGPCYSACTLFLGNVETENVCVTDRAELGFHSASLEVLPGFYKFSSVGTRTIWAMYPENVQALLLSHGWDGKTEHPDLIIIKGAELATLVRPCK